MSHCIYKETILFLKILFIYFRERGREGERERNINVWMPLVCSLRGTWSTTQAIALTGNRASNPLVHGPALNPLSYPSQGCTLIFECHFARQSATGFEHKMGQIMQMNVLFKW